MADQKHSSKLVEETACIIANSPTVPACVLLLKVTSKLITIMVTKSKTKVQITKEYK